MYSPETAQLLLDQHNTLINDLQTRKQQIDRDIEQLRAACQAIHDNNPAAQPGGTNA